eukprot:458979-Hanusia_phi.AAC.1
MDPAHASTSVWTYRAGCATILAALFGTAEVIQTQFASCVARPGQYCSYITFKPEQCDHGDFCQGANSRPQPCPEGFFCPRGAHAAQKCPA